LVRVDRPPRDDGERLLARFKAARENATLGGLSWKELRDAGRKY
jgi:hypothetical protein